ncbi:hypothetical protein Ga0123462_1349 [Mariprofundus ferrinatatus]|uniref:Uncharacterized protein n=1 Tax=Mariprofundus ferrinatatus TaxID=1921087 RepID=A0A2K8L522_9PROT|nr:hypothetical protein Ga0123462_1349 [Mariprofundus ferrinatatus]
MCCPDRGVIVGRKIERLLDRNAAPRLGKHPGSLLRPQFSAVQNLCWSRLLEQAQKTRRTGYIFPSLIGERTIGVLAFSFRQTVLNQIEPHISLPRMTLAPDYAIVALLIKGQPGNPLGIT